MGAAWGCARGLLGSILHSNIEKLLHRRVVSKLFIIRCFLKPLVICIQDLLVYFLCRNLCQSVVQSVCKHQPVRRAAQADVSSASFTQPDKNSQEFLFQPQITPLIITPGCTDMPFSIRRSLMTVNKQDTITIVCEMRVSQAGRNRPFRSSQQLLKDFYKNNVAMITNMRQMTRPWTFDSCNASFNKLFLTRLVVMLINVPTETPCLANSSGRVYCCAPLRHYTSVLQKDMKCTRATPEDKLRPLPLRFWETEHMTRFSFPTIPLYSATKSSSLFAS